MQHTALRTASLASLAAALLVWAVDAAPAGELDAGAKTWVTGSPEKLLKHYETWKAQRPDAWTSGRVELSLGWTKGRSHAFTDGRGRVLLDLPARALAVELRGLGAREAVDVWLVEHCPDVGITCDPAGDALLRHVARVALEDGAGYARASLADLDAFELEQVVVSEAGRAPAEAGLLFGSPGLFERLLSRELHGTPGAPLGGLVVATSSATVPATGMGAGSYVIDDLELLVALGEDLFFNETFAGNGRTCGTCHPAENNFTIDVPFISALPANDPLFVAENLPALDSTQNGGLVFENPTLMRQFGLIVENLDGFDDPANRFTMRSVQHTLGMAHSLLKQAGAAPTPSQRTGWSGDGAPDGGSLREFSTGAVTQHFPLTMGRVPGVDFRLPTPIELSALEAFQLSLGRPDTPELQQLTFLDADAEAGKVDFIGSGNGSECNGCHFNAGSNGIAIGPANPDENRNFDTGVEAFTQGHSDGTGEPRPPDGGFGLNPQGGFDALVPNADGSFGDGSFNAQSLIEVADTLPAFHSNVTLFSGSGLTNTVEGAVRFYSTPEFVASPPGANFPPMDTPTELRIARFLRVLNGIENARGAAEYGERAEADLQSTTPDLARVDRLMELAQEECVDGVQVLSAVGLHPLAVQDIQAAQALFAQATSGTIASRLAAIQAALVLLDSAKADMVQ